MRERFESDTGFYYAVGGFTIAIFAAGLLVLALLVLGIDGVGRRELGGLVGGFLVFMLVYFVSIAVRRLEEGEDI